MKFEQPYMLGLLLKKSDKLFIDLNTTFEIDKMLFFPNTLPPIIKDSTLTYEKNETVIYNIMKENGWFNVYGNETTHRMGTTTASKRIGLLFDFSNDVMALFRRIAKDLYWVMIGLILSQFVLLKWRGVGLLPVWVLIEYL